MDCDIEGEKAAEAVADDDRVIELVLADVGGDGLASGLEKRTGNARHAGESGERNHVQLVVVLVTGDRAVPDFAGAGEPGNEDHGATVAGDLDLEWLLGRQSGAECEGDQECFHSSDCVPGVVEDGVKCDERFLRGADGSEMVLGDRGTVMGCSAAIAAA